MSRVIVPPSEFASDERDNLGRANGNVYQRVPGVAGVHDGQIMVRLKKKRFIVIDYSVVPTEEDMMEAKSSPQIKIFEGAGRKKCTINNCGKIGVPVCLFDSEPNETDSLYLRSGMCFTCQRNLNEKRRTERKRTNKATDPSTSSPSLIYAIGPSQKKFKLNGSTITLNNDAVIINGAVEGIKYAGEGYGFQEIGPDMQDLVHEAAADVAHLVNAVSTGAEAAAAVAGVGGVGDDVTTLYEKAFKSLNAAIFLLSQWKSSWDTAVHTAMDPSLADAVASAAAVAAAAADGTEQGSNMVSLLLAADKRKGKEDDHNDVQSFEV